MLHARGRLGTDFNQTLCDNRYWTLYLDTRLNDIGLDSTPLCVLENKNLCAGSLTIIPVDLEIICQTCWLNEIYDLVILPNIPGRRLYAGDFV